MTEGKARLTFLGTGTSQGVPIIGCGCEVCRSSDSRDKRFRASALVEFGGLVILVDAGPDFRMQMLAGGIRHLDAILLTHNHKDHTGGLDDVRSLNYVDRRAAEIYCERNVLEDLIREYPYVFKFPKYPGAPEWRLHVIDERPFMIKADSSDKELVWVHDVGYHYRHPDGTLVPTARRLEDMIESAERPEVASSSGVPSAEIVPIRGYHDKLPVLGFRFGNIAYITDMSYIPESEMAKLEGLKHLTLNTVGYKRHHSHFSLEETLMIADRLQPEHTWLTHLSHSFPRHELFSEELDRLREERHIRSIVRPAYDGLVIE
ncbi:MAG: MBL fold metallo-hydrolase [Bacteroidales bacterium]|nr:MBL fold metallo-hydrolase [Bacteroidales bacterium]